MTFGMDIACDSRYRHMLINTKTEKATSVLGFERYVKTVPAECLAPVMGEASWLVTEGYINSFKLDGDRTETYVKYSDAPIDFRLRNRQLVLERR